MYRTLIQYSSVFFVMALCAVSLMVSACTPTVAQRGNMLENYQLDQLTPGQSGRSEVLRILGSPTTQSTFDSNVWYYIGQKTEKRGILDPEITQERIIQVAFDPQGVLDSVHEINRDRMNIPYVREKTKTNGNDVTVMQQFLGNLGKFNAPAEK